LRSQKPSPTVGATPCCGDGVIDQGEECDDTRATMEIRADWPAVLA